MNDQIASIGSVAFRDTQVPIYYDKYATSGSEVCCWGIGNPETAYTGLVYHNYETGMISYPNDAIIPEQTEEDREILPKFFVVSVPELTDDFVNSIVSYMDAEFVLRNSHYDKTL